MKAYKGFNKDLTCRGFQYEIGKTYEEPEANLCKNGFHACTAPLDVFGYYAPAGGRYHEVDLDEVSDQTDEDSKRVGKKITIGAEIGIPGLVKAHVEWVKAQIQDSETKSNTMGTFAVEVKYHGARSAATNTGARSAATNMGICSAATNTGDWSAAMNTGDWSAATNTGARSAATNTGIGSAATNTGDWSAATNTGARSAATNTGDWSAATNMGARSAATNTGARSAATNMGARSAATNTGDHSAATNTGDWSAATNMGARSAATNTGDWSAATNMGDHSAAKVTGKDSIAIACGYASKAKGALGCAIVVAERGDWNGESYPLLNICAAIVDGEKIKPDTWYTAKNGELVECQKEGVAE